MFFMSHLLFCRKVCCLSFRVRTILNKAPNTQYPIILAYPNANTQYQYRCMIKH